MYATRSAWGEGCLQAAQCPKLQSKKTLQNALEEHLAINLIKMGAMTDLNSSSVS